ncbi:glycine--tRNA ligase [Trifolium repens]|nr:glycine--tRNA ligase [Trifolium repens]
MLLGTCAANQTSCDQLYAEKDKETLENKPPASSEALESLNKQMEGLSLMLHSAHDTISNGDDELEKIKFAAEEREKFHSDEKGRALNVIQEKGESDNADLVQKLDMSLKVCTRRRALLFGLRYGFEERHLWHRYKKLHPQQFLKKLSEFVDDTKDNEELILYFSGHGLEHKKHPELFCSSIMGVDFGVSGSKFVKLCISCCGNMINLKYAEVADLEFFMFPQHEQGSGQSAKKLRLGEAVSKVIVNNEIECSYGWIECVGIADRSAYDLKAHSDKSGVKLEAHEKISEPKEVEKLVITPIKKELGLAFKGNQKKVVEALEAMKEKEALDMKAALESKGEVEFEVCTLGKTVSINKNMVTIHKEIKKEHQRVIIPSVIEPSFGIGRIMYCLFEHTFYKRASKAGDEQLNVFRFPPLVAPIKCTVFPLVQNQMYEDIAKLISESLTAAGISHKIDITGASIGKQYAKTDELGVPFAVTVDSTTSVTIRERDSDGLFATSKDQVRVDVENAASVIREVVSEGLLFLTTPLQLQMIEFNKVANLS